MSGSNLRINTTTARAVRDLLKSEAETRIYLYLLKTNGARTEQVIRGTKLHPSTVRELLSKMYDNHLIIREKLKTDHIGKNPYLYRAAPPRKLLHKYIEEIEHKLNNIANLTNTTHNTNHYIKIHYYDEGEKV